MSLKRVVLSIAVVVRRADSAAKSAASNITWEGTTWRIYRQADGTGQSVLSCRSEQGFLQVYG